jgi:acyl-CoA synthetase (AMP-forming)/AMP-acid ligase II
VATTAHVVPGVPDELARVESELTAPGGAFEIAEADVLGERMRVFTRRAGSLREHLESSSRFGESEYVLFTDGKNERRITFAEHLGAVASVAAQLRREFGVGPGDRVAIVAANCPEWIVAFWATVSLGAVAVGINGWSTGPEIRYGVDDSDPVLLIGDQKRLARLEGADVGVPVLEIERDFAALWHAEPEVGLPDQPIGEDDPALILYTSGTTGRPKGAVHTHRNVNALLGVNFFNGMRMARFNPPAPDAQPVCQLATMPLFHVSGLHNAAVAFLVSGVRSVWATGRFDPELVMRLIERERITGWSVTPTMLHRVVEHPDFERYDLSSLRQVGGGGSTFSPALQRRTKSVVPQVRSSMGIGYGLTECTALATLNSGGELTDFPDSVGRPVPTMDVEIRGRDGAPLPDGEDGEIHVRGPLVMLEYWRKPVETAEVIGPGRWLRTGDIGRMEAGRLYLASRKRDLILRGGENVYPVEIENRLEEHSAVDEAAVVGVDHEELGQEVKAVVVAAEDADAVPDELAAWVGAALAPYKVPVHWEIRPTPLPRNATGKVLKHLLVDGGEPTFVEE